MIPIGFITGNSYGVLRYWNRFRTDFLFNYIVTPRYEGQPDRVGYLSFLQRIPEIIGEVVRDGAPKLFRSWFGTDLDAAEAELIVFGGERILVDADFPDRVL